MNEPRDGQTGAADGEKSAGEKAAALAARARMRPMVVCAPPPWKRRTGSTPFLLSGRERIPLSWDELARYQTTGALPERLGMRATAPDLRLVR